MESSMDFAKNQIDELVINWHVTESCNYKCKYCYATWRKNNKSTEILLDDTESLRLLDDLYSYFNPENRRNPLRKTMRWKNLRLSIAGGEALLYPKKTRKVVQYARQLGFRVSLITNGSLLAHSDIPELACSLSMIGLSVDSISDITNKRIGRVTKSGRALSITELVKFIGMARLLNPELFIKINTVVNSENVHEDMTEIIERVKPKKWKVLQILPIITDQLSISNYQFDEFVYRHRHLNSILSVESNKDMTESYLMVDPLGQFFQNHKNIGSESPYTYSEKITEIGSEKAFSQIRFDCNKYFIRYSC